MTEYFDELYETILNEYPEASLLRIATELSSLIHCYKDKKVEDEYVLTALCTIRNAIWKKVK